MLLPFFTLIVAAIFSFANAADPCMCASNQTLVASTTNAWAVNFPTSNGTFSGTPCATSCKTVITYTGTLANGSPAGANVALFNCNGLSATNTLSIYAGNSSPIKLTTCPTGFSGTFPMLSSNVITLYWELTTPASGFANLLTAPQEIQTTTAPPPPTTTPYSGPLSFNPGLSRVDLTIGLDLSTQSFQFYANTKPLIKDIIKYFKYSVDLVRLSFITIDPFGFAGTGKYPLWGYNDSTLNPYLDDIPPYPGNNSKYATVLSNYFNQISNPTFALRNNTERVFMVFTGSDASNEGNSAWKGVQDKIDATDMKFLFVNMDPSINASAPTAYQFLKQITGTGSNAANWFNYQLLQNNAENFLNAYYFNGNTLCSRPSTADGNAMPLQSGAAAKDYQIPALSFTNGKGNQYYCNYMRNKQVYQRVTPSDIIRVYFSSYDIGYNNDFIRISVDGTEVSALTGQFGSAFYCLNATTVTVAFESNSGMIYGGYASEVSAVSSMTDCKGSTFKTPARYIEI